MDKKFECISYSPSEAQKHCHFVVFIPTFLPKDLSINEQSLRPESAIDTNRRENNRATFRQVFKGADRTLVIKQFLYDWAPPAYDYPCLWRNNEIATQTESPAPKGEFVNHHVLWFGKNYRKQEATTIEIERTRIEMTVEKGTFSNEEIVSICKGLVPANPKLAKEILDLPFSELSYSRRYEEPAVSVPVGYWRHMRSEELMCYALAKEEIPSKILILMEPFLKAHSYLLNSGFGFGKNKDALEEIELIFESQHAPGCLIRILSTQSNSHFSIAVPPTLDDQECFEKTLTLGKHTFYYATSKNFAFGPHEIVFKKEGYHFMLLVKPTPWTSFEWVMELLRGIE